MLSQNGSQNMSGIPILSLKIPINQAYRKSLISLHNEDDIKTPILNDLSFRSQAWNTSRSKNQESIASQRASIAELITRKIQTNKPSTPTHKLGFQKSNFSNQKEENFNSYAEEASKLFSKGTLLKRRNDSLFTKNIREKEDSLSASSANDENEKTDSPFNKMVSIKSCRSERMRDYRDNTSAKKTFYEPGKKILRIREYLQINYFLIFPDDSLKYKWDILIALILLFTAIVTPFRIAFYEDETPPWSVIDWIIMILFGIDLILNFFTAVYDSEENLIIERKEIVTKYLKSWFIVDFAAVFPISFILNSNSVSTISRLAKLPRLYRLIKMSKLVRILKIVKGRSKLSSFLNSIFKINTGVERLLYLAFIFLLMCHLGACLWYFLAKLDDFNPNTWIVQNGLMDKSDYDIYIASFYFTLTTVTTVGYGDISSGTTMERFFSIFIMLFGVCAYSFAVGSMSSVLSSLDSKNAKLDHKMNILDQLKHEYQLNQDLYLRIRQVIKYDHSRDESDKIQFVNELPPILKSEIAVIMHRKIILKIPFFQKRDPHFMAFVAPLLRPIKAFTGQYIFTEKQPIDDIFFVVTGKVAYVLSENGDLPYITVNEGCCFGELEFLNLDQEKRLFSVRAMNDSEIIAISKMDLLKIQEEFPEVIDELFENGEMKLENASRQKEKAQIFAQKNQNTLFKRQEKFFAPSIADLDASWLLSSHASILKEKAKDPAISKHIDQIQEQQFSQDNTKNPTKDNAPIKNPVSLFLTKDNKPTNACKKILGEGMYSSFLIKKVSKAEGNPLHSIRNFVKSPSSIRRRSTIFPNKFLPQNKPSPLLSPKKPFAPRRSSVALPKVTSIPSLKIQGIMKDLQRSKTKVLTPEGVDNIDKEAKKKESPIIKSKRRNSHYFNGGIDILSRESDSNERISISEVSSISIPDTEENGRENSNPAETPSCLLNSFGKQNKENAENADFEELKNVYKK